MSGRGWGRGIAPRGGERRAILKPVQHRKPPEGWKGGETAFRAPAVTRRRAKKSGVMIVTTREAAIAAYRQFQARQASGAADTPASAAADDALVAHRAAAEHAVRLLVPSYRQAEQQRAAAAAADRQAALPPPPPPRDVLREAHRARAAARAAVERLQTASDRARGHLTEVSATRDAAKRNLEALEAADTARLIDELASGTAGRVEPAAGEQRVALAECEHQVEIASRAADKISSDLAAAQQNLEAAGARVTQAIVAMLLAEAERQAVEILAAVDALDVQRQTLDALGIEVTNLQRGVGGAVRQPWPAQIREALAPELRAPPRMPSQFATPEGADMARRWATVASALLADPEAVL
jgi:hypothetical protein